MKKTLLIADSGATKTAWILHENGKTIRFLTSGISPFLMTQPQIEQLIRTEFPPKILRKPIYYIYYYGTGCKGKSTAKIVTRSLESIYKNATISVTHDLMGAAIASCGDKAGIACILGTGSNSCYFNGKKIISNSPGLGYVLGDEASGAYYGKLLVQHYLYKKLDSALELAFEEEFKTSKDEILHHVYKEPFPNRYLANFAKFLSMHRGHYLVENIIEDGLRTFFDTHLLRYAHIRKIPVHFVGSIAFYFQDKIYELCNVYGFQLGKILKNPIDALSKFHQLKSGSTKK